MPNSMSAAEFERLIPLADASGQAMEHTAPFDLLQALAHWAAVQPDRHAVIAPDGSLTYGELERLSRVLAGNLKDVLQGSRAPIVVCGQLGRLHLVALVAGLHLGVPVVPLDPALSSLRNRQTVQLVGATAALCTGAPETIARHVGPGLTVLSLDALDLSRVHDGAIGEGDDPAMIVFTSGSTGQPKGVAKKRQSMGQACRIRRHMLGIGPRDVAAFAGSSAVSGAHFNCWTAIISGATLIAIPGADSVAAILDIYAANRVTVSAFYVGLGRIVAGHPDAAEKLASLRAVTLFGDVVQWDDIVAMRAVLNPRADIFCSYGATEVSWSTGWIVPRDHPPAKGRVPIGRALPGATLWLDPAGETGTGELVVTSPRMSLGYWNDEERTGQRFCTLPDGSGRPVFRTGDLVRLGQDGLLAFLGRDDNMVKLRGRRVELEEIETVARKAPGVVAAGVVPRRDEAGAVAALALYVAFGENARPDGEAIQAVLREELPRYMWPVEMVALAALPMNQSAKVDRNRLRELDLQRMQKAGSGGQAASGGEGPTADMRERIAACIASELGVANLDEARSFMDYGGDSLKALGAALAIERRFDVTLDPEDFFDDIALGELMARVLRALGGQTGAGG